VVRELTQQLTQVESTASVADGILIIRDMEETLANLQHLSVQQRLRAARRFRDTLQNASNKQAIIPV
jgi:hypothetical protein